ncbi:S-layer homology domain-containing protein [Paenibacillus sp. GCM10027627]|uniref:S-layer homology domain-containing protein n=1 Tax=unclassified Paenibacillus TaxID=185978 RepID=UPI003633E96B
MPIDSNTWKKLLTGALAITLVTGSGTAVLSSPVAVRAEALVSTTPFTDVAPGHWAEKHIAKLYLQKVITGYEVNGKVTFAPEKNVSQQEAVLLALKFSGLVSQADDSSIIVFDKSFVVTDFYKKYVELAFTKGLLDREEEYKLASADKANTWGTKPASREWVTKLIVKAIGQGAVAEQLKNTPSSFKDAAEIDAIYKGYVNAAVQLGLVKGMDQYTFAPNKSVTRASLATLFSRAQAAYPVNYEGQTAGIVSDLAENALTLYKDDKETTYTLDANTLYYHYNTEKPIKKDQLLEYGDATVIAKDGKALYVEVKGDVQHVETITGTYARYNAEESIIYVWIKDKPVAINYNKNLIIENSDGKAISILDLKPNAQISVIQDKFRSKPVAIKIVAAAAPVQTQLSGELVSADQKVVTIKTKEKELISKYVAPGATVEISGLINATFDDLIKTGDHIDQVEVTLNDKDQVTKVKVTNRDIKVLAGAAITSFDEARKIILVVDSNNEPVALKLTDKTKFDYMGTAMDLTSAMTMAKQNVHVVLRYTGNSVVSLRFVLNYTGTITEIDVKNKSITLMTTEGVPVKLPYTNTSIGLLDKPSATHLDLKTGDVVTLVLNLNKMEALSIQVHRTDRYELVSVDVLNKKVKIKTAVNDTYDILVANAEVILANGTKGTLGQLIAGNAIQVSYVGTTAVKVQVMSNASNG